MCWCNIILLMNMSYMNLSELSFGNDVYAVEIVIMISVSRPTGIF